MIWTTLEGEGSCLMAVNIAPPANQVALISRLRHLTPLPGEFRLCLRNVILATADMRCALVEPWTCVRLLFLKYSRFKRFRFRCQAMTKLYLFIWIQFPVEGGRMRTRYLFASQQRRHCWMSRSLRAKELCWLLRSKKLCKRGNGVKWFGCQKGSTKFLQMK